MNIPELNSLKGPQLKESYFKNHYTELYNYIIQQYDPVLSFQERLFLYYNNLQDPPVCKMCGKNTKFINTKEGYRIYCSTKCLNSDPDKIESIKRTNNTKYGGNAPICSDIVKNKIKDTCIDKYGVYNPMKSQEISNKSTQTRIELYGGCGNASDISKNKQINTCIERYGVKYISQTDSFKEKVKNTCIEKYGVTNPLLSDKSNQRRVDSKLRKIQAKFPDVLRYNEDFDWVCSCPDSSCNKCQDKQYIITSQIYRDRKKIGAILCTKLNPINSDNTKDTSIELFVQNILNDLNIFYIKNDRSILNGKELDIYIPDYNVAIECNGIYRHSIKFKDQKYHYNKYIKCKEKGIQLISIWEDQIRNTPDIVRSIIKSKLHIYNNKIGARQCTIKLIDQNTCDDFLNDNHIQGSCQAKIRLGLYYKNNLISVMTFGKSIGCSGNKKNDAHILKRFCTLKDWQVIGGANKLLQYYIKNYNPNIIESFACNDISNGDLYLKLGFEEKQHNNSYWYIKNNKRYHRSNFTKNSIVKRGWKIDKNGWTEKEVMLERGYYCIYDCGQTKYVLSNKKTDSE